jgi:hypothetical protein
VLQADWFDPEINPKLADFCRHYGLHVMPCRSGKPEHKGKVENGVAYVRNNALKGRRFRSLTEENLFLQRWEANIADKRIHGTTRKQVAACFEEERPYLQPAQDRTMADAKAAMEQIPGCQDAIVTKNGDRAEPMIGWLSNIDVSRLSAA